MPKLTDLLESEATFRTSMQAILKAGPGNVLNGNPGLKSATEIDRWLELEVCSEAERNAHRADLARQIEAAVKAESD